MIYRHINAELFIGLIFLINLSCNVQNEPSEQNKEVAVKIASIKLVEKALPIRAAGVLSNKEEMKLSFKTGGIIEKIYVEEGAFVKRGQILAQLNLSEIEANVKQAETVFEKAKRDYERVKLLYADSVASLENMQDASTMHEASKANYEIAKFNLNYSKIYAPANGIILKKVFNENEIIGPGMPVLLFGSNGKSWVAKVGVTDKELIKLRLNDAALVRVDPYPDMRFMGKITKIAEIPEPLSGVYEVEINIDKTDKRLATGFIVMAEIESSFRKNYCVAPIEALVDADKDEGFIFIPVNGIAKKSKIKIVSIMESEFVFEHADFKFDKVVTEGALYLEDGRKIKEIKQNYYK